MKNKSVLLAISFVSTALTDTTLFFENLAFSIIVSGIVYFLVGFLFYDRIKEEAIRNSFLIFLFLIALITFGSLVNPDAYKFWISISSTSILLYLIGVSAAVGVSPTASRRAK